MALYRIIYHRMLLLFFLSLISCGGVMAASVTSEDVSAILKRLDHELSHRDNYVAKRQRIIDSLRNRVEKLPISVHERLESELLLGENYSGFNADSAIYHYSHGLAVAQAIQSDTMVALFQMRRATLLPLAGFIQEALLSYQAIDTVGMPVALRCVYHDAGRQMYSYMASFCVSHHAEYERFTYLALESQAKLIPLLGDNTLRYKLNQGEYYFLRGEYSRAKAILTDLLDNLDEDDNMFARASHFLSGIALARNERNEHIYYLALSAISDIKSATLEVSSLQELGQILFSLNDVSRSHRYLSVALRNAVECRAPLRILQSAESLPIIESAHAVELEGSRRRIYVIMALMGLLLVGFAATLTLLRRKMISMNMLSDRLEEANRVKDIYINQFLDLCSIYMDRLNQFSKTVNRKISAGKVDDLYNITKSGKFIEEQSKAFYKVFDDAFLHIYPTFVEDVNALLRPEEQIELHEGEKLNTDLRILAFMRLGIEESSRIAQLLNYSVYTIYTYRNRLKNRAIVRETFESDMMNIKSIS